MSVKEILREIEALPSEQRWTVLEGVRRLVDSRFVIVDHCHEGLVVEARHGRPSHEGGDWICGREVRDSHLVQSVVRVE